MGFDISTGVRALKQIDGGENGFLYIVITYTGKAKLAGGQCRNRSEYLRILREPDFQSTHLTFHLSSSLHLHRF